jgi:1-acyl-sn-glycerol-3-phosphate acyltransferase
MQKSPQRLSRASLNRGNLPRFASAAAGPVTPRKWRLGSQFRAMRRTLWILCFLPFAVLIQSVLIMAPGRGKDRFAALFWAVIARCIGLHVHIIGAPLRRNGQWPARPVIYVCNHSSWLDIPAIGSRITGRFVSKDDVATWPVIRTIARLGRTVYVSRNRSRTLRERDDMQQTLAAGDDLFLFPEGTSSDGARVLPFRSPFFAAAYCDARPLVQPVSIVYDRLAGLPVGHASRSVFAWYGDMNLLPHYWQLAQWRGKRVALLFHAPLDPADFTDRKALALATWQVIADGAAALRQNRQATPLPQACPIGASGAAFA